MRRNPYQLGRQEITSALTGYTAEPSRQLSRHGQETRTGSLRLQPTRDPLPQAVLLKFPTGLCAAQKARTTVLPLVARRPCSAISSNQDASLCAQSQKLRDLQSEVKGYAAVWRPFLWKLCDSRPAGVTPVTRDGLHLGRRRVTCNICLQSRW